LTRAACGSFLGWESPLDGAVVASIEHSEGDGTADAPFIQTADRKIMGGAIPPVYIRIGSEVPIRG